MKLALMGFFNILDMEYRRKSRVSFFFWIENMVGCNYPSMRRNCRESKLIAKGSSVMLI